MKCICVRKELSAYIDGEVSSRRRAAIENHLAECPDCKQYKRCAPVDGSKRAPLVSAIPAFDQARANCG